MVCDLTNRVKKRVLIRIPNTIRSQWSNTPSYLFETVNYEGTNEDWLIIYPNPIGGWVRRNNYEKSQPQPKFSSASILVNAYKNSPQYVCNVTETIADVYYILQQLVSISISTNRNQLTPIVINDYCTPDYQQYLTSINGRTDTPKQRQGIITLGDLNTLIGKDGEIASIPNGFNFTFYELDLYLY